MVYKVDYLLTKGASADIKLPRYVVADSFDSALKAARKFETDTISLFECAVNLSDGYITIARGFKGLEPSKATAEEAVAVQA